MARLPQVRPADVPSVQVQSGIGDALTRTGQAFFSLSREALGQAENAAVTRADEQGAALGATGVLGRREPTNRANVAFNRASEATFSNRFKVNLYRKVDELRTTYRNDPVAIEKNLAAWYQGERPNENPALATNLDLMVEQLRASAVTSARNVAFGEAKDSQAASLIEIQDAAYRTIEQVSPGFFSGDPEEARAAMGVVAMTIGDLESHLLQTDPSGKMFFSQEAAAAAQADALEHVLVSGLKGWVDAQPSKIAALRAIESGDVRASLEDSDDEGALAVMLRADPKEQLSRERYTGLINYAKSKVGPEQARIKRLLRDELASVKATGRRQGLISDEDVALAFPDTSGDVFNEFASAREFHHLTQVMALTSPAEDAAIIAAAAPSGEGFADELAQQGLLQKVAEAKYKALGDDPALYVFANSPEVQASLDRAADDPSAISDVIDTSLAEQRRMGVLPGNDRVLTKGQTAEIQRRFDVDDPQDVGDLIEGLQTQYGPHWPKVYAELTDAGMPTSFEGVGYLDRPNQTTARIAYMQTQRAGVRTLEKSIGSDGVTAIKDTLVDAFAPFKKTLAFSPRGGTVDGINFGTAYAVALTYSMGMDPAEAAARAAKEVTNDSYTFVGTYRVPAEVDEDRVIRKAGVVLRRLGNLDIAPYGSLADPRLSVEDLERDLVAAIQDTGFWITNPDGSGLMLMDSKVNRLPVMTKDGEFVGFTWDELDVVSTTPLEEGAFEGVEN